MLHFTVFFTTVVSQQVKIYHQFPPSPLLLLVVVILTVDADVCIIFETDQCNTNTLCNSCETKHGLTATLVGATGVILPKVLLGHSFLTCHPSDKFHPNQSSVSGNQDHHNIGGSLRLLAENNVCKTERVLVHCMNLTNINLQKLKVTAKPQDCEVQQITEE